MDKEAKAKSIIEQDGKCNDIDCDYEERNECPCYDTCKRVNGGNIAHPDKVAACRSFLTGCPEPDYTETWLDKMAGRAMQGIIASGNCGLILGKGNEPDDNEKVSIISYQLAEAMLAEKLKREKKEEE